MPLPLETPIPTPTPPTTLLPNAEALTIAAVDQADVVAIVAAWHDDTHPDAWRNCDRQPCYAIHLVNSPDAREYRWAIPDGAHGDGSW